MKKYMIAGNWKMNTDFISAIALSENIVNGISKMDIDEIEVALFPPTINIAPVIGKVKTNSKIAVGAQNCYFEKNGAYTGEVSPEMIKSVLADYVIIGHSERRTIFGETDEIINLKLKAVINVGLIPVLCIGESLEERKANNTMAILINQLDNDLEGLTNEQIKNIVIAYEPIWAIGTGVSASPEQAAEVHNKIRNYLNEKVGTNNIFLLYGGSMNAKNAHSLLIQKNINGGLIGGASLKADEFIEIITITKELI